MRLVTLPGVFRPISDSWLLADALADEVRPGAAVVDVGTGSGALAVAAGLAGAGAVTAIDVSRRALASAVLNGALRRVRVRPRRGFLLDAVPGERFDVIVSNPPYVPGDTDALPARGPARAWDAGRDGRALLDRLLADAPAHLRPGGALLVVHSDVIGAEATLARMAAAGLEPAVVRRQRGPLGPLMSARVRHLEAQGLLAAGRREEDVLVFCGRAPAATAAAVPATARAA